MNPEQLRSRQAAGQTAPAPGVATKIAPEMRDLLVKQAAEAAAAQTATDIDAHNARIDLRERHVEEAKQLAESLKPKPTHATHETHDKGSHRGKASK